MSNPARILLLALVLYRVAEGQPAEPPTQEPCPDAVASHGLYENSSFGFSIVIPGALNGFWNSAGCTQDPRYGCVCMPDHGRIIPLSTEPYEPERHIEVFAAYADGPNAAAEARSRLHWIRARSREGSVKVLQNRLTRLAGLEARRLVVRFRHAQSNRVMIEDAVELIRPRENSPLIGYSLYLRTPNSTYRGDRSLFETVLRSFALTTPDE